MRKTLGNFGGIQPRQSVHNLDTIQATIAHDVKLRNGRLEPWRDPCGFAEVSTSDLSFHIWGCCVISWPSVVYAAEMAPDFARLFITGRTADPEFLVVDRDCNPTYYKLGVPTPDRPPRAIGTESCGRDSNARAYVFTWVNSWGEESAPSPASNILTVADGATVNVVDIQLPPDGYGIRFANIYRASTGFRATDAKQQTPLTDYQYVTTIEFPTASFADNVRQANLSYALETQKVKMAPEGLTNLTSIDIVNRLAGTVKNRVYVSENHQPYNWPVKYELTLDHMIVHMAALDDRLFVTTTGTPYVIDLSSCEEFKCVPVMDVGVALPDIACKYASSAVMTQHGYVYSSPLGLILVEPSAKYHILTKAWFSEDDWAKLQPDTARLGYWEGFLFCITDAISFILNIDTDTYGDLRETELSTISDKPVDLRRGSTGELYLMQDGLISVWNRGKQYREFEWVSRELTGENHAVQNNPLGNMWSAASAKVRTQDTEFTLISPYDKDLYVRKVINEKPFRLPRVGRHMWFKVRLRGKSPVEFLDMGTAHFTVNQGQ